MLDPKTLDDLARRLADSVPPGLKQFQADMEKNFHALLQSAFARMDLVTREEFEVQTQVLARTRARLESLEARVGELEKATKARSAAPRTRRTRAAPGRGTGKGKSAGST